MLKDKYTCPAKAGQVGEEKKLNVSNETYALLDAQDEELIALEKLRLGVLR